MPYFGIGMKTDLFQSCGLCWVFHVCWHIECSTFTASSFRIWNSSTGIPSPLLGLFIVMLPKAHLTLHSRMSGSRWIFTPSWLSRSWRSFLYSSSMYSYHLFLISSASVKSLQFLSFIEPIFAWNVPLVSPIFLKRSLVFPWRRQWHPTPVLLLGNSHGWKSLVGYSPWDLEESDTTERLHFHFSLSCIGEGNGNPLQCSCLENPRDGGAWWAAVYGVAQSWTRLKRLSSGSSS